MRRPLPAILFCLMLVAAACGGKSGGKAGGGKAATATTAPPKPVICPLTGQERPPGFNVERPALAIKVENSVPARPQAGLESADIVYEELTEGGITRFLAIFHCSDSGSVGPVRSARLVDADILQEYTPVLLGFSGANATVLAKVRGTAGVIDLSDSTTAGAYERVRGRTAPHNLFTTTDKLRAASPDTKGPPKTGLVFGPPAGAASPSPAATASPAAPPPGASVSFAYSGGGETTRYAYDAGSRTYKRFHRDTPHNGENGAQFEAVNVIVMKVPTRQGSIQDAAGNVSPEITVTGEGEAIVLVGGVTTTGRWKRPGLSDRTTFVDGAGNPIPLAPGSTWIHLVPEDRPVTVQ